MTQLRIGHSYEWLSLLPTYFGIFANSIEFHLICTQFTYVLRAAEFILHTAVAIRGDVSYEFFFPSGDMSNLAYIGVKNSNFWRQCRLN